MDESPIGLPRLARSAVFLAALFCAGGSLRAQEAITPAESLRRLQARPVLPASAAPIAAADLDKLLAEAAVLEKSDCEAAYLKFQLVADGAGRVAEKVRAAELESIAGNKLDKLQACYSACQPTGRAVSLLDSAKEAAGRGENKRAAQITRKLMVGKNDKCRFFAEARQLLAGLPDAARAEERIDPCEVTPEVQKEMEDARRETRRETQALSSLAADKAKLPQHLADLIELYRQMDRTRATVFELREEFLDCDAVYKPLVEDAGNLRESSDRAQDTILSSYQAQLTSLAHKVRTAQAQINDRNKLLGTKAGEQEALKKQFDALSAFNEDLYDDLFNLAGSESLSFATTVEGRRMEKPLEEIHQIMADEGKTVAALQQRYPEYFQDGVNVEGLKRRKLVLEKIQQMLQKFGRAKADTHPAYGRAVEEVSATVKMMDKAIAANDKGGARAAVPEKSGGAGVPGWLYIVGAIAAAAGITFWRVKSASNDKHIGLR